MNVIPLRTRPSDGPIAYTETDTGAVCEHSTPCPACDEEIDTGALITRLGGRWYHARCVTDWLAERGAPDAWLVLGSQLARTPSRFTAKETSAIVGQLLRLAGGLPAAPWEPEYEGDPT